MLIIKTFLRETANHVCLHAGQDILADQKIIKNEDVIDRWFYDQQVRRDGLLEFFAKYAIYNEARAAWRLPGDNARFINHSRQPNLCLGKGIAFQVYAKRNIKAEEELTLNYFDACDWVKRFGLKSKINGQKIL